MNTLVFRAFSEEMTKLSALQPAKPVTAAQPQPQQQQKKPGFFKRNFGGTMGALGAAGGLVAAGALATNPKAAKKFLGNVSAAAKNPVQAMRRGMNTGASFVGEGADKFSRRAAQSKRVEIMNEAFEDALRGTATQHDALREGAGAARRGGWMSVGERSSGGLRSWLKGEKGFEASAGLQRDIKAIQEAQKAGRVDYKDIESVYRRIGQEAADQGVNLRGGIGTYIPGERAMEVGGAAIGGLGGAAPSTDEYGNKRGVTERLARGAVGAGLTAGTAHLLAGRNMGLSKSNVFNPLLKKIDPSLASQRSLFSQKMLVPAAAGLAMAPLEGAAGDIAGGAGSLVDRAFGQSGEQS
jgi:hypothetical protein